MFVIEYINYKCIQRALKYVDMTTVLDQHLTDLKSNLNFQFPNDSLIALKPTIILQKSLNKHVS